MLRNSPDKKRARARAGGYKKTANLQKNRPLVSRMPSRLDAIRGITALGIRDKPRELDWHCRQFRLNDVPVAVIDFGPRP